MPRLLVLAIIIGGPCLSYNVRLNVPFKSQVLPGSWSSTLNCGQTSVLMVNSYYKQSTPTEQDVRGIDDWLFQQFGDQVNNYNGSSTYTGKLVTIAQNYFGLPQAVRHSNWSLDDLRAELNNKRPIIVAVWTNMIVDQSSQARHFMVLTGMDDNNVYLNDPGHTNGKDVSYPISQFDQTWADQNRSAVSIAAQAPLSMNDDFNGTAIDTSKWDVVIVPSGIGTILETNQRAEMTITAAGLVIYEGLQSRCKVSEDFDVQVDFTLLNWPAQNFYTVRLSADSLPAGPLGVVGIYRNSYNNENVQMRTVNGVVQNLVVSDSSGKMRLVRTGSTISGYYWNGSQFILLGSSPTTTIDTRIVLDFASPSTTSPPNVKIAFDNFMVNKGTVSSCQ